MWSRCRIAGRDALRGLECSGGDDEGIAGCCRVGCHASQELAVSGVFIQAGACRVALRFSDEPLVLADGLDVGPSVSGLDGLPAFSDQPSSEGGEHLGLTENCCGLE